jgi:hypothetical protein
VKPLGKLTSPRRYLRYRTSTPDAASEPAASSLKEMSVAKPRKRRSTQGAPDHSRKLQEALETNHVVTTMALTTRENRLLPYAFSNYNHGVAWTAFTSSMRRTSRPNQARARHYPRRGSPGHGEALATRLPGARAACPDDGPP